MESQKGLPCSSNLEESNSDSFSVAQDSSPNLCSAFRCPSSYLFLGSWDISPCIAQQAGSLGLEGSLCAELKASSSGASFLPGDPLSIFSYSGVPDSVL